MFIPFHDKNELRFIPFQFVTILLIAVNVAVFFWQGNLSDQADTALIMGAGMIPTSLFGSANLPPQLAMMPPELTLISHMFLHGDWLHLTVNMVFLWVFGDNVEDAMGHMKFLVFFVLCGMVGGYAHALAEPNSDLPLIGASGATSGIIGAYILLYPRAKVWALILLRIPLRLPALWLLTFWLGFQIFFVYSGMQPETAWWAHLGGFAAGCVLVLIMRRNGAKLFGPHPVAAA